MRRQIVLRNDNFEYFNFELNIIKLFLAFHITIFVIYKSSAFQVEFLFAINLCQSSFIKNSAFKEIKKFSLITLRQKQILIIGKY